MSQKVIVCGACGRMGQELVSLIRSEQNWQLVGAIEAPDHPQLGKEIFPGLRVTFDLREAILKNQDVTVIEFTTPSATLKHLQIVDEEQARMVIGTTGFKTSEVDRIKQASERIPVLLSPNMSVGINLLFVLVKEIARVLPDFDKEVIEAHHRRKQDAPSGTANRIAEILAQVENKSLSELAVYGRKGIVGEKKKGEIGIHSIRAGSIVGDHTVLFAGEGERMKITHRAESRRIFARGALVGARFLLGKEKGFYDLQDALGIKR